MKVHDRTLYLNENRVKLCKTHMEDIESKTQKSKFVETAVMVSKTGQINNIPVSKISSCLMCAIRTMENTAWRQI